MKKTAILVLAAIAAGCTSAPSIQQGPDAEMTFDGLVRIDNSRFKYAWVDPDVDLTQYTKIMPVRAEFEFRAVKQKGRPNAIERSSTTEFWISDENRQKLIDTVSESFRTELAKSTHFTITDTPGPDTLIIVGALHDIVSRVPPEYIGRGEIYLRSVGDATLVLEAKDSLSGETIYRATDRRSFERTGQILRVPISDDPVMTWDEVRRAANRWAARLREGLDSIHE